jgi:hypothetical protein
VTKKSEYEKWEERMWHPHDSVLEALDKKAKRDGWEVVEEHLGKERGIDMRLRKNNCLVVIEAVGERASQSSVTGRLKAVLGAIIMRMDGEEAGREYRYCVAFPATEAYYECSIPVRARKLLRLSVVFADCRTGALEVVMPDARGKVDLTSFDELFDTD